MTSIFAFEAFGREIPSPSIAVIAVVGAVLFFLFSRSAGGAQAQGSSGNRVGRGRMHTCERCSRRFQPEQVELLSNGEVKHWFDERCPNCGWEVDWGSPNKPGGSSGHW